MKTDQVIEAILKSAPRDEGRRRETAPKGEPIRWGCLMPFQPGGPLSLRPARASRTQTTISSTTSSSASSTTSRS